MASSASDASDPPPRPGRATWPPCARRRARGREQVRGLAAGRVQDQQVPRSAQRLDLARKYSVEAEVVGRGGEQRGVRGEGDRRQCPSGHHVAHHVSAARCCASAALPPLPQKNRVLPERSVSAYRRATDATCSANERCRAPIAPAPRDRRVPPPRSFPALQELADTLHPAPPELQRRHRGQRRVVEDGAEQAELLTRVNPRAILADAPLTPVPPLVIRRTWLQRLRQLLDGGE